MSTKPLGFADAVRRGVRAARFDWVYLANNDVVLDRRALAERHRPILAALRAEVGARALKRVVFAGYVSYKELVGCYAMADLFVHAAADEPWGVSVQEAIACGLPVVASSRVGAARDLVLRGRNGFVYAWGDAAELLSKLTAILDTLDPETVRRANREVLARWNYARTWDGILEACA